MTLTSTYEINNDTTKQCVNTTTAMNGQNSNSTCTKTHVSR